jgi:hypothetical protein
MKPRYIPIDWLDCRYRVPVGFHPMASVGSSGKINLAMKTKTTPTTPAEDSSPNPVFPFVIRQRGAKPAAPGPKAEKRDNIFSKSRDTREDRGERQIKTSTNTQSQPHGR